MKYNEFVEELRQGVSHRIGSDAEVSVNHVYKNNGKELDGMVILEKGKYVAPTIYINDYYKSYMQGQEIEEIIGDICSMHDAHKDNIMNIRPDTFNSFENIRNRIVYKLVNYNKNEELLSRIPYKKVLDLAVIYCYMLDTEGEVKATALIHNEHIKVWGIDVDELHEAAVRNTPDLLKAVITPMATIIERMLHDSIGKANECDITVGEAVKIIKAEESGALNPMYILTNEEKYNGAACMLYDNVLKEFAEYMNSDMYILPSSVHEVIILLKNEEYSKDNLEMMVREVNRESVEAEEILSDTVYEYNRKDGFIRM